MRGVRSALSGRGGRRGLAALGIAAAAAMAATAVTVGYGLRTGFDRSATRSHLPDVVARFGSRDLEDVDRRARALPNVATRAYRAEFTDVPLAAGAHSTPKGTAEVLERGPHAYAIVAGRDVADRADEVVIERGLADAWDLRPGSTLFIEREPVRVVGVAVSPETVAFPLVSSPRFYASGPALERELGRGPFRTNVLELRVRDRSRLDVTLVQARATSAGLKDVRFVTRSGIRTLIDGAAGIVIALLGAFALVALLTAGAMLAGSAQAEVQRRLPVFGVLRAVGQTRARLVAAQARDAAALAALAAALGVALGGLAAAGPTARLLYALNELPPGGALVAPLALCWAVIVVLVVAATAWPAWRAARRPPAALLRGADLAGPAAARAPGTLPPTPLAVGARTLLARPGRLALGVLVTTAAAAVVLLMLSMAALLLRLRDDPATLGKRFSLTADVPAALAPEAARLPGVAAAAPRYVEDAADSFSLGQTLRLIAFPGDHTELEASPLLAGRRERGPDEAEVGLGLADALGLRPGATLAAQLPTGREVRYRVVGVVDALEHDGRVAYVTPDRLLAADPSLTPNLAVRLRDPTQRPAVADELAALIQRRAPGSDVRPQTVAGATSSQSGLTSTLAAVLRVVAIVNVAVCLYALLAVLTLVAAERRGLVALLRALGASRRELALVFAGAAAVLVGLAVPAAILLESLVLAPLVGHVAASYVTLALPTGPAAIAVVVLGLPLLAWVAAGLTARRAVREPIVAALSEGGP